MWNTTGIDPSKKGVRQDILFVLAVSSKIWEKYFKFLQFSGPRQNTHPKAANQILRSPGFPCRHGAQAERVGVELRVGSVGPSASDR